MTPPGVGRSAALWEDAGHYRLRPGTERFVEFEIPVAAHLALGTAVDHALALGLVAIAERVGWLAEGLRADLSDLAGVAVHDGGAQRSGIVTFTVEGVVPSAVVEGAAASGINVSASDATMYRLDLEAPNPGSRVRASPHYYNTEEELSRLVEVVDALTGRRRPR